ncbi:MAG: ATPase domain-containing protein [Anaerolineae bacterium]
MHEAETGLTGLVDTGISGLDDVLHGGLTPNRLYLVEGDPGSGKTTLALQFLLAGVRRGERCLFVTLSETEEELRATARSHGWTLDGISILEIVASEENLKPDGRYTMFHPSEVELTETMRAVLEKAEGVRPDRLVFDSLSELRLLAQNPLRYRHQILALKQFFARQSATVLFVDDKTGDAGDMRLHSISHGVISLERRTPDYGTMRRRLQVTKVRGRDFRQGFHDYRIVRGGLEVYPRLVAAEHLSPYTRDAVKSGVDGLDDLLGGGLSQGTSTLILGPAGAGKSTIASQYAVWAARQGQHAICYLFDESIATFRERLAGLGMDAEPYIASGRLTLRQVDAAELAPGEFAYEVRRTVDQDRSRIVVIDSLNGYLNAMPSEQFLTLHLHELLTYLGQQGVTTILIMAQHGFAGGQVQVPIDASYLADTVLLLRYFEARGEVRQSVSVIKKRTGPHERTIREMRFDHGIVLGEPVREFQGVLTGAPVFIGKEWTE